MDNVRKIFEIWANNINDKKGKEVLNNLNHDEIYESFYKNLEFGTAGLRGIMGIGTNRMNIYTVRQTTQGFADYLNGKYKSFSVSAAISYDSRNNSYEFAKEAACVLAANNIKVYITDELKPTPVLSFAVRNLKCRAGIMLTASHNPPEYNGYKCYGNDGAQILDNEAKKIYENIKKVDMFKDVKLVDFESGLKSNHIEFIKQPLYDEYVKRVMDQGINTGSCKNSDLSVVYTPLNGAGNKIVKKVIKMMGIEKFYVVPEQENPDGNFTTCKYPNPESEECFSLAKDLAKQKKADLIISTDPDCDRIGVCVFDGKEYVFLTGNQIGILLVSYILKYREFMGTLPKNPVIIKTIVSTDFIDKIAKKYNCKIINVLTGFKYIGNEILKLEKKGESQRYILGFEESHGYLIGTYTRDKDAVAMSMMICEMAAFYKKERLSLLDVLENIHKEFGNFYAKNINIKFSGNQGGIKKIQTAMDNLRKNALNKIGKLEVKNIVDYMLGSNDGFPRANIMCYELEKNSVLIIRPSGTEPKIKIYVTSDSEENINNISEDIVKAF
ncbi:MAG: phospho-sugar mutase [Oscillospiraceae bacterium]|nr:phospho-sugar mutase [Oscillospiraceae bacterium]